MRRLILACFCLAAAVGTAWGEEPRIAIWGDSTAKGDGAQQRWHTQLGPHLGAEPEVHAGGVSRYGIRQIANAVEKDEAHRDWITIFYDRRNAGESADQWLETLGTAIAQLETDRFLILPQVPVSGGREDGLTLPVLLEINEKLRAAYPDNAFDAVLEAAFLAALADDATRSDRIHRNDTGQAIEARFIGEWIKAKGW